jgi:DNA ligase-1
MVFETLYNIDKKGAIRLWKINVVGSTIYTESGLVDGEKVKTVEEIKVGKNIGRKNETTPHQQANLEAASKWKKKSDKGYSTNVDGGAGKVNYNPMLAHEYKKHQKKVKFPCYVQPKLDGYRMVYDGVNDRLLSRTGKPYDILVGTGLHKELQKYKNHILDGELYVHSDDFAFELYGVLRKKKLSGDDAKILDKVLYNIYDMISPEKYSVRLTALTKLIKKSKYISLVQTDKCDDFSCIQKSQTDFISKGYEGLMVRNADGLYIHNRSTSLLKFKIFDDAEFVVVGYEKENDTKGDGATPVIWICITMPEGKKFKVASKGTREERSELYRNGQKYIGKMLSVQFFGLSQDKIPRFPKTLREGAASFRVKE